jgi:hypothetical protein
LFNVGLIAMPSRRPTCSGLASEQCANRNGVLSKSGGFGDAAHKLCPD